MRKNGEVRNGKRQRRANGAGSLIKMNGIFYMRFRVRDEITGKSRKQTFSTHLPDTDLEGARRMLNEKARELGFTAKNQAEILLEAAHNAQHERERVDRERAERERAEIEAKAKADAEERAKTEMLERDNKAITLGSAFSYYLASKRRPDSGERTLKGYETQFEIFVNWLRETYPAVEKMRDFTPDMAEAFLDHLEKTRSRNTRNKYLVFLRTLWRVLRWEPDAQLTVDPWDGIKNLVQTADAVTHKELTVDELHRVVSVIRSGNPLPVPRRDGSSAGGIKDAFVFNGADIRGELLTLFAVGIFTGLRLGDCVTLDWGDVDLARGIIYTEPRKTARKYKRRVIIPIHPTLGALLTTVAVNGVTGFVVPSLAEIYLHREPSMLTNRIQAIFRAAEITTTVEAPTPGSRARTSVGFHSLRHTFASIMLNAGAPFAMVEKMLGHSQESMTAHYFHENADALRRAVTTLPSLPVVDAEVVCIDNAVAPVALVADAQSVEPTTDTPQSRFDAFRALVGQMDADELKRASVFLADRTAGCI